MYRTDVQHAIILFIATCIMNHHISWRSSPWFWGRALHCLFADSGFQFLDSGLWSLVSRFRIRLALV